MRQSPASSTARGFSLPELLVGIAILAIVFLLGIPALGELNGQMTIRAASTTIATILHEAHMRALFTRCDVGIKWTTLNGDVVLAVYQDGNDNGVTSVDIRKGVDKLVQGPVSMKGRFGRITFSFIPGFAGLDPSGAPIGNLADPIRLGLSDISSFSPSGSCTPGSIYISDQRGRQEVVRMHPIMSRIQVLEYRAGQKRWERLY
jgi:prepilin-type N-terminal cleavage/methylation domain-containing protein